MNIGIVNLNLTMDRVYHVAGFVPGTVARVANPSVQAGGKGVNAARVLKTLGESTVLTGCVGGTIGAFIRKDLSRLRVPFVPIPVAGESRVTSIFSGDGRQTVVNEEGPRLSPAEVRKLVRHLNVFVRKTGATLFCGSAPRGVSASVFAALVRTTVKTGQPVLVDIGGAYLAAAIAAGPSVIKVNEEEWQTLPGRFRDPRFVFRQGVEWLVITRGARGFSAYRKERSWSVRVPKLKTVNAIGCGDALAAAFMAGILRGWKDERILTYAAAVSAAHALTPLPGEVRKKDIALIEKQIIIREVKLPLTPSLSLEG